MINVVFTHSAQSWTSLLSLKSFIVTSSEWYDEPLQAHKTSHDTFTSRKKYFQGTSKHPSAVSSYRSWAFITDNWDTTEKAERKHKMMRLHFSQSRVTISTYVRRRCFQIRRQQENEPKGKRDANIEQRTSEEPWWWSLRPLLFRL